MVGHNLRLEETVKRNQWKRMYVYHKAHCSCGWSNHAFRAKHNSIADWDNHMKSVTQKEGERSHD